MTLLDALTASLVNDEEREKCLEKIEKFIEENSSDTRAKLALDFVSQLRENINDHITALTRQNSSGDRTK